MTKREQKDTAAVDSYDYLGKSASTTDYTGLIPFAPQNDYELESYENVYPFRPSHIEGERGPNAVSGKADTHSEPDRGPSDARG